MDDNLKNVVLMTSDPITAIQALGRKRVKIDKEGKFREKVNLYFQLPSFEQLNRKYNRTKIAYDIFRKDVDAHKYNALSADKLPDGFFIENSQISVNWLYGKQLEFKLLQLETMLKCVSESPSELKNFISSWFEKDLNSFVDLEKEIQNDNESLLIRFLNQNVGNIGDENGLFTFAENLKPLLEKIGYYVIPSNKKNKLGINLINKNIKTVGFQVVNIGKNAKEYKLERLVNRKEEETTCTI